MLKIGAQDITGLYVGETKIEKAYLGEELVYSAGVTKEYQDYEYFSVDTSAVVGNYSPYAQLIIKPRVSGKTQRILFILKLLFLQILYLLGVCILILYIAPRNQ